jgi:pimeloyl-ACP methyl ester carboxylesterase
MDTNILVDPKHRNKVIIAFAICLIILVGATVIASLTQRDFGKVDVTNVTYPNFNTIPIRAKLFRPVRATQNDPVPGIVYIHGYQNNRETGDAYCIELARRGFVVLNIDAIGRGNSGIPNDVNDPDFDETYGGQTSLEYLKALPFVDAKRTGMMGHSLGAEMAYNVALNNPTANALVISGFAYTLEASTTNPKNMLMIIGKWDEYRERMTGTQDIEKEWMSTPQTRKVIPAENPQLGVTYGDFAQGTARRVFVPHTIHIQESHSRDAIAEALLWMKSALQPAEQDWVDPHSQIWPIKEWATLITMLAGFASLLPLGLLLLQTKFFGSVRDAVSTTPASASTYSCSVKSYFKFVAINGILMWLYLPLIFALFGLHVYVVHIDKLFPMMMVNGIVWWFVCINVIGFLIFRRWFKRQAQEQGLTLLDLGISYQGDRFALDGPTIGKTILLAAVLFAFIYFSEHLLEQIFIVEFRFIFPFASDLTPYRVLMFLIYFPLILIGFVLMGIFLHGQLRRPRKETWLKTFASWSLSNTFALIAPLIIFMFFQYVPLLTAGIVPFVGPGGMLASFVMNLFHIIGVLIMTTPISTWFYQLTGKIYLGALVNAALVTWMFTSSQVIAPIPV